MLPVTFQRYPTQISRCKKKLFFLANHNFRPQITGWRCVHVHAEKNENYRFFKHVKEVFNKNWGIGRDRLYLVSSVV